MKLSDMPFSTKLRVVDQSDVHEPSQLGTKTYTEVKKEQTDKDPVYYETNDLALGTETFTKTRGENTDKDFHN